MFNNRASIILEIARRQLGAREPVSQFRRRQEQATKSWREKCPRARRAAYRRQLDRIIGDFFPRTSQNKTT